MWSYLRCLLADDGIENAFVHLFLVIEKLLPRNKSMFSVAKNQCWFCINASAQVRHSVQMNLVVKATMHVVLLGRNKKD